MFDLHTAVKFSSFLYFRCHHQRMHLHLSLFPNGLAIATFAPVLHVARSSHSVMAILVHATMFHQSTKPRFWNATNFNAINREKRLVQCLLTEQLLLLTYGLTSLLCVCSPSAFLRMKRSAVISSTTVPIRKRLC